MDRYSPFLLATPGGCGQDEERAELGLTALNADKSSCADVRIKGDHHGM
jgi:hypothetical protein